jgi:hypothetical protein
MIPTMILLGLVLGRWWWLALLVAGVAWPAMLVVADVVDLSWGLVAAGALAAANAAVGVLVHQAVLHGVRHLRHHHPHPVAS